MMIIEIIIGIIIHKNNGFIITISIYIRGTDENVSISCFIR